MRRLVIALVTIAAFAVPAAADKWSQKRQNLVDLAIAPDDNIGTTRRVFCPIETAAVGYVICFLANQSGDPIGHQLLMVEGVPASEYTKILNSCAGDAGSTIRDGCFYEVDVVVTGSKGETTLQAIKFYPAQ